MKLKMGSHIFDDVEIPLLWGTRAVLQDGQGRISVIDLSGDTARLEILGDKPGPGVEFAPTEEGVDIIEMGERVYSYNPKSRSLTGLGLNPLPECEIGKRRIRVGSNIFAGNVISGFGVGILVTENEVAVGAPLPPHLAKLVV